MDKKIIDILINAIKAEIDSFSFFKEAAKITRDKKAKKTFSSLAADEGRYRSMTRKPLPKFTASQKAKEKARKLVNLKTDEIKAVRIGIVKETKSLAFYEKWSKRIKDGSFKEILELLALEEKGHKALLQKEYKALLRASF